MSVFVSIKWASLEQYPAKSTDNWSVKVRMYDRNVGKQFLKGVAVSVRESFFRKSSHRIYFLKR